METPLIRSLDPRELWANFYEITQIPHPSKHEKNLRDFLIGFARSLNLKYFVDDVGNLIISKPATPGFEQCKGVILQAHLDMVPQKNTDKIHNFETDPIETIIDDEWVRANGTTLGADNGFGIAAIMTILESKDCNHGPLEALFTIDEETGLVGAFGLKPNILKGKILLNLDAEEHGELLIGCAGGSNANITFHYTEMPSPKDWIALKISLLGLSGGHSGENINLGRANANKVMNELVDTSIRAYGAELCSITGGSLRNAIPRESFAVVIVHESNYSDLCNYIAEEEKKLKSKWEKTDPKLLLKAEKTDPPATFIDRKTAKLLCSSIRLCPDGVVAMSKEIPDLVETSNNLAIIKSENGEIFVQCLLRSSVDDEKNTLEQRIKQLFKISGAEVNFDGQYPGWKPIPDSEIVKIATYSFQGCFDFKPRIRAIHAGLECGIIGGTYPDLEMISFGPTIKYPHSPDEKVNIESVAKFWAFLINLLLFIPNEN